MIGICDWWKRVDDMLKCWWFGVVLFFDYVFFWEFNNYFVELCIDDVYMVLILLEIGEEVEIFIVLERVVWNIF